MRLDFKHMPEEGFPFEVVGLDAAGDELWRKAVDEPTKDGELEVPDVEDGGLIEVAWPGRDPVQVWP